MQESSKITKFELGTSLNQDDSLTESLHALPEAKVTLQYDEELNREQLRLLNYSRSEIKYLVLSVFLDPWLINKDRHILIKILSMLLYFGQIGGLLLITYGFFQDNFPMVGLYLPAIGAPAIVGISFRLMLIFFEKTILKAILLRRKIGKVYPKSEEYVREIRYPFALALKAISDQLEPETAYNWNPLTPHYNQNLSNIIPSLDEFQKICEDFLEWNHKNNGFQLLYAMTAYKFTLKTIYHAGQLVLWLIAGAMTTVAFIAVESIMKDDIFGICVRLDIAVTLLMAGLIFLAASFSANHEYLMAPPPEEFISIDKLYRRSEERAFIIDVFSIETLETYMLNYFKIRKIARHSTRNQEYPFVFLLYNTLVGTAYAFALTYSGLSETEPFGYGFIAVIMFTMLVPMLIAIILHLFIGALFNQRPINMIKQLRKLKELYIQMERLRQGKYAMSQMGQKMQFLFECIEKKDVDFKALEKKVNIMIEDINFENETSPYKFLSVFECTTRNIGALLVGISGLLSLALVKYSAAITYLIGKKFY